MAASRALGRALVAVLAASVVVTAAPAMHVSAGVDTDHLLITFDGDAEVGAELQAGAPIADTSGYGNDGVLVTEYGGSVTAISTPNAVGADFPGKCGTEPCPNALVQIADSPTLDPGTNDFEWGAELLLQSSETADGENVLQKGLWKQAGGQWKLQVDKSAGLPSCVVSGRVPGQTFDRSVVLISSIGVADGRWHHVACRRTAASGLQILVDGVVRGRASMPVVDLDSDAPVTIGAKTVIGADNDQFHGVLDDVYMTVLNEDLPVDVAPVAAFTSQCVDQSCTFDGSSSTDDGALSFAWDFGDAATDTVVAPTHEFADIGDHDVTLVVTDAQGASASIVHTVTTSANEPPVATFSSSCRYSSCSFDASGSTDASPLTYAWDFGDGATDTAVTPVHVFSELGDHLVRLTVTDPSGLTGVSEQMVSTTENTPPIASFIESCTDLACTFDASASSDAGPLTYSWAFGDGASATLTDPAAQHSFSAGGTFHVVLTVIDDGDATAVAEHDVTVTRPVEPITFVGRSTSSTQATAFSAAIPNTVQAGDALLMFVSLGTGAKVGQPAGVTGWVAVDTLTTSSGSTHVWRKVASASDAGRQVRVTASSRSKGNLTVVAYRGTSTANPIAGFARSLLTNNSAYRTTPTTTVAAPTVVVSYWMHRDNKTTSLTVPAGVTSRSTGTESGNNHVTVLVADSGADVPAGPYGGLTSRAMAASTLGTAWTIVLAPA